MQSIFSAAKSQATADIRFPAAVVRVSWKKALSSETLATVGASLVGGLDVVAGAEGAAMPWNSYQYFDESDYILALDYDRAVEEPLGGIAAAMASVLFDNTGKRYTPDYNQTVGTALGPDRPIMIDAGFIIGTQRTVPVFKGSTVSEIRPDFMQRTAAVRAADIITLLEQTTLAAAMYEDQRSDQIIEDILTDAGIGSSQYDLDTGLNTIPFAWFPASMDALQRIRKVCEAEEATFYQDEAGVLRFETRLHYKNWPHHISQITLKGRHMLEFKRITSNIVINRCIVKAKPRQVDAANAAIWTEPEEIEVEGNSSKTIWARFTEPDSSVPMPVKSIVDPVANTDYTAFDGPGGTGSDITADQTVTVTNFVETAKIVLQNSNASKAYYNLLQLRGKAARVQRSIEAVEEDSASQSKWGVHEYVVENDFIQDLDWAEAFAHDLVEKYKEPTTRLLLKLPGLPHLQLKDKVSIVDPDLGTTSEYRVMRIQGKLAPGSFTQDVVLREITSAETAT